jgi:hypothetical protein
LFISAMRGRAPCRRNVARVKIRKGKIAQESRIQRARRIIRQIDAAVGVAPRKSAGAVVRWANVVCVATRDREGYGGTAVSAGRRGRLTSARVDHGVASRAVLCAERVDRATRTVLRQGAATMSMFLVPTCLKTWTRPSWTVRFARNC